MAKIEWNKVTWYSKILALALFVALPFIGFWYGMQYGEVVSVLNSSPAAPAGSGTATIPTGGTVSSYYSNVAEWQTYTPTSGVFSIAYPIDFQVQDSYSTAPDPNWTMISDQQASGLKMFALVIPRIFESQTNFDDATLTVGKSSEQSAVVGCLNPDQSGGPNLKNGTTTINGVPFSFIKSSGVGAGNFYDTTSYRTIHGGACYAVEYTIHSSQLGNYPPEYGLKQFDPKPLTDVLDRMVGTFKFL